ARSERSLFRAAYALADLTDRAEMVGEVCDAGNHAWELDAAALARLSAHFQPALRFVTQPCAYLLPRAGINGGHLPGLIPFRIGERIATLPCPAIHQRKAVTHRVGVRRNGRAF